MKTCGRCGARYDDEAWKRLEACGSVAKEEAMLHVVAWPPDARIDLKRCRACGVVLARRAA